MSLISGSSWLTSWVSKGVRLLMMHLYPSSARLFFKYSARGLAWLRHAYIKSTRPVSTYLNMAGSNSIPLSFNLSMKTVSRLTWAILSVKPIILVYSWQSAESFEIGSNGVVVVVYYCYIIVSISDLESVIQKEVSNKVSCCGKQRVYAFPFA